MPSNAVRTRIMQRVGSAMPAVVKFPVAAQPGRAFARWLSPIAAAALAVAPVYGVVTTPLPGERVSLRADLATQSERSRSLESAVEQQAETARLLRSREAVVATLAGSHPQPEARSRPEACLSLRARSSWWESCCPRSDRPDHRARRLQPRCEPAPREAPLAIDR